VEVFYAANKAEVITRLGQIVGALRAAGVRPADVVVLGPRRREHSSIADVTAVGAWRLKDLSSANSDELSYSTIHSFKGLERPIVIVVDAGSGNSEETDSLLYVAMSRARIRLFLVCPEEARQVFDRRLIDGFLAKAATS
jgi:superfamily I DNA/RNA helicase